jgi:hydrogenase 3 maturation protease
MSNTSWQACLKTALSSLNKSGQTARLAVMGIGNELCGDDAAGLHVAATLSALAGTDERLLVLEAGPAPENFTGPLRRFNPDLILLVDAAQMDSAPGSVCWVDVQEIHGFSASTHTLPLHIICSYLTAELGCQMALVGIQPTQTYADDGLTPVVQQAAENVARGILEIVDNCRNMESKVF